MLSIFYASVCPGIFFFFNLLSGKFNTHWLPSVRHMQVWALEIQGWTPHTPCSQVARILSVWHTNEKFQKQAKYSHGDQGKFRIGAKTGPGQEIWEVPSWKMTPGLRLKGGPKAGQVPTVGRDVPDQKSKGPGTEEWCWGSRGHKQLALCQMQSTTVYGGRRGGTLSCPSWSDFYTVKPCVICSHSPPALDSFCWTAETNTTL